MITAVRMGSNGAPVIETASVRSTRKAGVPTVEELMDDSGTKEVVEKSRDSMAQLIGENRDEVQRSLAQAEQAAQIPHGFRREIADTITAERGAIGVLNVERTRLARIVEQVSAHPLTERTELPPFIQNRQ